ncbi:hypothetical protein [Amycolatopsis balhimycina]|uniref:hypothetical protein n=1 Tax=Amycolatopsis balhimycina TaxID=208443 RepID=UPI000F770B6D|nr:hypothetical protein [Amycolatopsis balhimycina]
MSVLTEFGSANELEALLRAAMVVKFEQSGESELLTGSPVFASAVGTVRESLIEELRTIGSAGNAQRQADWYRLSQHRHLWAVVASRAASHPRWRELDEVGRISWIETLAAPLTVDRQTFSSIQSMAEGPTTSDH